MTAPTAPITVEHRTAGRPGSEPAGADSDRLTIRRPASRDGHIDAAWWPRTDDLVAELPMLLRAFPDGDQQITRVTYNLLGWSAAPRRTTIDGRVIRLGGFRTSDPLTVRLLDPWGQLRIDVLVIPTDTDPQIASRALAIAGRSGSVLRAADILALAADDRTPAQS